jgi:integrase
MGAGEVGGVSVTKLPSGRWRAQVYHDGRNVSVSEVLDGPKTFATKTAAKQARAKAREILAERTAAGVTVREFWERWTTDQLWSRPKESTNIHNRERSKAFVEAHGSMPIDHIGDLVVQQWLAGGKRNGTIPTLRAMFNDAASAKGGRLVRRNPFADLGVSRGTGRRFEQPPSEEMVWSLIGHAQQLVSPDFAAWLQVAAFTGMRPCELDALQPGSIDWARDRIKVVEQFNSKSKSFTMPKNGLLRDAPLTAPAREALRSLPLDSRPEYVVANVPHRFCFLNLRDGHWTASSRTYHWNAVRAAAGWTQSLYLATRHFAGWYMVNVLEMSSEDVAIALGHEDGGELVRRLYGHRDKDKALDRVVQAYAQSGRVKPLRLVKDESA